MKTIEIKHRFTSAVLYSCEVADDDPYPMRTAIEKAVASRAYLAGANLAGANLARAYLADAYLAGAYLADAYLADAYLADAYLADAYLAGAYLADAYLAGANLAGANLAGANLARAYLARAYLADAYLADAYLADAYLAGANLARAYLADAYLADAYLAGARHVPVGTEKVNPPTPYARAVTPEDREKRRLERMAAFRARNPEVPVIENLDAKILAAIAQPGCALDMGTWHSCETTHCRAGWAIHLAGKAGYALEKKTDAQHAGSMIYRASTGRVPHFFASDEDALADIRRCAAEESK